MANHPNLPHWAFADKHDLVPSEVRMDIKAYAAAVSAAENAALRAEFARAATRLVVLGSQVKVLEDALRRVRNDKSFNCLKIEKTQQYVVSALEAMN